MNFYLDFEATQYSEKIISIGCVCDNGNTFYSLVKPSSNHKLSKFIVQLTGITDEMLKEAPNADEVFLKFKEYVQTNTDGNESYLCYGDSDKRFVSKTIETMKNFDALCFAKVIKNELVDIAKEIGSFFGVKAVALKKVVSYLRNEPIEQNHISLEDALMLKEAVEGIAASEQPSECPFVECLSGKQKTKIVSKPIVDDGISRKGFQAINIKTQTVHKFNRVADALAFIGIPKNAGKQTINRMTNNICQAALNQRNYSGYEWSKIERIDVK